jgi:hypothetical protein
LIDIYPLDDDFGLLHEGHYERDTCFISLIFLDLYGRKLEKVTTIEYPSVDILIFVNKIEPTEFLVHWYNDDTVQICKVEKISIILGEMFDMNFWPQSLYDERIYSLDFVPDEKVMSLLFTSLVN